MSVRAVAHFERKGWPLRPYCYECSSKAKTAAAQQKRLERQRAAKNLTERPLFKPLQRIREYYKPRHKPMLRWSDTLLQGPAVG